MNKKIHTRIRPDDPSGLVDMGWYWYRETEREDLPPRVVSVGARASDGAAVVVGPRGQLVEAYEFARECGGEFVGPIPVPETWR